MHSNRQDLQLAPRQEIYWDAVFWIYHDGHRKPHLAIVLEGQLLPACWHCGLNVRYVLASESSEQWGLSYINEDRDFLQIDC